MARRSLIILAPLVVALALLPAATASAALEVISPHTDRFFSAGPVVVKLKTAKSARSVAATLEGKKVGGAFERVKPGLWRARFGAAMLKPGANHLVVSARDGGGREYVSARFLVGKRERGMVTLGGPRGAVPVAQIRIAKLPRRLSAKLNGKKLRWPLDRFPSRKQQLRLGADDGLHFGRNQLQVLAIRRDGSFDVERRTVLVPRDRPLAGAGRDRRQAAGRAVRLDGRSSRAVVGGRSRLSYRWEVVRKPRGAEPKLRRAGSARPLLLTDKPGAYRVRLTVTEPRRVEGRRVLRSSADVATVSAVESVPPVGLPVETMATRGGSAETGLRIGAKTYWLGEGDDYQIVVLDRSTLAVLYAKAFQDDFILPKHLEEVLKSAGSKALVLISNPGEAESLFLVDLAEQIGADVKALGGERGHAGWSAIGVYKSKSGAYLAAGSSPNRQGGAELRGSLSGYLQPTSGGGFAFNPGSRVTFDTVAPGGGFRNNTIKVATAEYPTGLPSCADGGFQVQVLLAETLAPAGEAVFATNGGGNCGQYDEDEQKRMAETLNGIALETSGATAGPKLVIVQSMGSPYDPNANAWGQIATALERFGGTASVFAAARSSYSLVGGLGISRLPLSEASETLTGKAARITGVLKPDRQGAYVPMLSSPSASTPYPISAIAYQPPQPWPASQSREQKAALRYIAEDVLKLEKPQFGVSCYVPAQPDVRSEYCNLRYEDEWSNFATELKAAKYPAGQGFTKSEWEAVVHELAEEELRTVQSVWKLVSFMQKAFGVSGAPGQVKLNQIATEIEKAITPPPKSEAVGWWLELFGNFGSVGSYFKWGLEDEDFQKALGVIQGLMFESAGSIYGSEGEPLYEGWELKADDVAVELAKRNLEASIGIGYVGEILVSDYGKLQAMRNSGLLGISAKGFGKTIEGLEVGAEQWSYQNLLPIAYEAVDLTVGGINSPMRPSASEFECEWEAGKSEGFWRPFAKAPKQAELRSTEPTETLGLLVKVGSKLPQDSPDEVTPVSPTEKLMKPIVEPGSEGLPYYGPWFWRQTFNYPSAKTKKVFC